MQIGQSAGATLVLYGACRLEKDQLQISARVLRVDTDDILELGEVGGPLNSLFALQDSVIRRFLDGVNLSATDMEWEAVLRRPTRSVRAYAHWVRARGMLTGDAEDPDVVRDHLDRALAEDADYADAHSHLGLLFVAQRRFKEALGALQTAVRLKPDDPLTRYNLGVTYASLGQPNSAAIAFRDAIRLKPDDPITHYNLGILHHLQGNHEAAIAPLQTAVRLKPDFAVALSDAGHCPCQYAIPHPRRRRTERGDSPVSRKCRCPLQFGRCLYRDGAWRSGDRSFRAGYLAQSRACRCPF